MIASLPSWINVLFILTCTVTIVMFHFSNGNPKKITLLIIAWSIVHSVLAYVGFYQDTTTIPPRAALFLVPSLVLIIYGVLPKRQSWLMSKRNMEFSTFLHSVRLPVEIVLWGLYTNSMIPELMTFEGRNFDIVMGITAPMVAWMYKKKRLDKKLLLVWNIIGLCFVLFIFINGIFSVEFAFQQFGFEQPNRAVNYFPFILLPATVVPIVIWSHLSDIIKLSREL